jgi:SAM-dependent methyltransferase
MVEKTDDFWKKSWDEHCSSYLATPAHLGPCLDLLFPDRSWSFLEMAGGSMRDAAFLAETGRPTKASDYLPEIVTRAKEIYKNTLDVIQLDAFNTGLASQAFDVTYHNGLWVNFTSDDDIRRLADEQARITKRYMVAVVHCAHNRAERERFAAMAKEDRLYDIRFFEVGELRRLIEPYGRTRILPCGSAFTDQLINRWRWGRLPKHLRRLAYKYAGPRTAPDDWSRIMAVTAVF